MAPKHGVLMDARYATFSFQQSSNESRFYSLIPGTNRSRDAMIYEIDVPRRAQNTARGAVLVQRNISPYSTNRPDDGQPGGTLLIKVQQ